MYIYIYTEYTALGGQLQSRPPHSDFCASSQKQGLVCIFGGFVGEPGVARKLRMCAAKRLKKSPPFFFVPVAEHDFRRAVGDWYTHCEGPSREAQFLFRLFLQGFVRGKRR